MTTPKDQFDEYEIHAVQDIDDESSMTMVVTVPADKLEEERALLKSKGMRIMFMVGRKKA